MTNFTRYSIGLFVGMVIGMFTQCLYDVKHITPTTITKTDTIRVTDTLTTQTTITKYKPTPTRVYKTTDTVYIQNKPTESVKIHKVYNNTIDTTKTLTDTLKYSQRINYHITTTDTDIDTIQISTQEKIPYITRYIETTKTNTQYVTKKPKLTIGTGIGYGINTKGNINPYLGIFVGYPIFSW